MMDGGGEGGIDRRSRIVALLSSMEAPAVQKTNAKPGKSRLRRAPSVVVSGRGRLTVRGNLNIIEKQVVVNQATRAEAPVSRRTRLIALILARCANYLGDTRYYRAFIECNFGKSCLHELADAQLERVKQYVMEAAPK